MGMKIVIVGGGAAGLFASLLLGRAAHEVVLIEQDTLEPAPDVETAAAVAFRPACPQVVQPHVVMARCRELLSQRLPDVYEELLAAHQLWIDWLNEGRVRKLALGAGGAGGLPAAGK